MSNKLKKMSKDKQRADLMSVVAMPWGGERNEALHRELGLVRGETGLINRSGTLIITTRARDRAEELGRQVSMVFRKAEILVFRRQDGQHVVSAYLAVWGAA